MAQHFAYTNPPQQILVAPEVPRYASPYDGPVMVRSTFAGYPQGLVNPWPLQNESGGTTPRPIMPGPHAQPLHREFVQEAPMERLPAGVASTQPAVCAENRPAKLPAAAEVTAASRDGPPAVQVRQECLGSTSLRPQPEQVRQLHIDLYEEAFTRKQRLHDMQLGAELAHEREAKRRLEAFAQGMRERRRLYRSKDTRSHLEREAELLRRREETTKKKEVEKQAQDLAKLRECTFRPKLTRGRGSPSPRSLPPSEGAAGAGGLARLRKLAERQRMATASLKLVAADEVQLRDDLHTMHAALQDRYQHSETQRVVEMLRHADKSNPSHGELIQRVQATLAAGNDPDAMQAVISDLVEVSNREIQRLTQEALRPKQLEAQGELYERRLALVQELEAVEVEAEELLALHGAPLREKARELGVELGLAEHALRSLPARPESSPASSPRQSSRSFAGSSSGAGLPDGPAVGRSQASPRASPRVSTSMRRTHVPGVECSPDQERDPLKPVRRRLEFMEGATPTSSG